MYGLFCHKDTLAGRMAIFNLLDDKSFDFLVNSGTSLTKVDMYTNTLPMYLASKCGSRFTKKMLDISIKGGASMTYSSRGGWTFPTLLLFYHDDIDNSMIRMLINAGTKRYIKYSQLGSFDDILERRHKYRLSIITVQSIIRRFNAMKKVELMRMEPTHLFNSKFGEVRKRKLNINTSKFKL